MSEKTESSFDMVEYKRQLDENIEDVMSSDMLWDGHRRLEQDDYQANTVGGFKFGRSSE